MNISKPNRTRAFDANRNDMQQKQSGDQHVLPFDEPLEDPQRPHRVSRQDDIDSADGSADRNTQGSQGGSDRPRAG